MAEVSKETRLSDHVLNSIESYKDAEGLRYRADAVRQLLQLGLKSSENVHELMEQSFKRLPLTVSSHMHNAVDAVRRTLPPGAKTYEIAYRLVIIRGLRAVGHDPHRPAANS